MPKPKIIFDTDPGVDDVLALLLLLASDDAELALITINFGNTDLPHAYKNVLKVYHIVSNHLQLHPNDQSRFPGFTSRPTLCYGASGPLSGNLHMAEYFHGPDGLSDITTTHPEWNVQDAATISKLINESEVSAEDAIIDMLLQEPDDSVTVIAVGPLTNIARAWMKNPEALQRARRIVVMGGALDVPGNTSATAEFNFFADPKAVTFVMDAAKSERINLVLAPLDLTTSHAVPFSHLIHPLLASGPLLSGPDLSIAMTPLRAFTSVILHRVRRVSRELGIPDAFAMHDPLAVWVALAHAGVPRGAPLITGWGIEKRDFVIECLGHYTKGMCVVDRRGGTDQTGAVRAIDGAQGSKESAGPKANESFGVNVLISTPGLPAMEKEITEKLFWDLDRTSLP
ncbi:nucleoside hydrolase [Ceratobasidium sp. AG-I]|nr:nucleoside hydrolase [Ceratobasidium sp. AG-I]